MDDDFSDITVNVYDIVFRCKHLDDFDCSYYIDSGGSGEWKRAKKGLDDRERSLIHMNLVCGMNGNRWNELHDQMESALEKSGSKWRHKIIELAEKGDKKALSAALEEKAIEFRNWLNGASK
jgi:hypothetical protein